MTLIDQPAGQSVTMRFTIDHTTTYRYSRPVFLEPHMIRLCPRSGADQRLHSFEVQMDPAPAGQTTILDAENNTAVIAWFNDTTEALRVSCRAEVETLRSNPFDYLVFEHDLPVNCDGPEGVILNPYRIGTGIGDVNDAVGQFATSLLETNKRDTAALAARLTEVIYADWKVIHREEGSPWPAEKTLAERTGSCRDVTVLFMEACRRLGAPARFVSGYQEGDPDQTDRELHAWPEVYIPGGGWRGYDPTQGLVVADRHVAVASSAIPIEAAPITGNFRGTGATAMMQSHIELSCRDVQSMQQQQQQ